MRCGVGGVSILLLKSGPLLVAWCTGCLQASCEVEYVNGPATFSEVSPDDLLFVHVDNFRTFRRSFVRVLPPKEDQSGKDPSSRELFSISINGSTTWAVTPYRLREWGYESQKAGNPERKLDSLSCDDYTAKVGTLD